MFHATLKSLWSRKRRLLGASTAVVIGVAFLVATLVLGDSMRSGFDTFFTDAYAGTDLVVRNDTSIGSDDDVQTGTSCSFAMRTIACTCSTSDAKTTSEES